MDRSRKRKATTGASSEVENGASKSKSKRQKTTVLEKESNERTTRIGLQLVEQLKAAKDKSGRLIADLFVELPDKEELPDYYEAITLPVSIGTIENKLQRHEYHTLTTVESDFKRMIANAKLYNDDTSVVFQDAERIRKLLSNFMMKHNSAYRDPDYFAFPTPLPGEEPPVPQKHAKGSVPSTREHSEQSERSEQPRKITLSLKRKSSAAVDDGADTDAAADSSGKTFQQAQEQLISDLIKYTDDDGVDAFHPFVNLPSRSLTDYYQFIKKPVSLVGVRKRVRGQHGRDGPTGVTDFKTWDALEEEVSYIWKNARDYNEDGSDMYNLAGEFEQYFKKRLALARQQVEEPAQPKIKLSGPRPKPMLHLGARSSPAPRASVADDGTATPKTTNGQQTPATRRPSSTQVPSRSNSQIPTAVGAAPPEQPQKVTASSPPASTAQGQTQAQVKTEKSVVPSPSLSTARLQSAAPEVKQSPRPNTSMPPPALRGPSGSPHSLQHVPQAPVYVPPPPTFVDQYARTKPVADALLPSLCITTNPQLNQPKPFRIDIPASPQFTLQSLTITLPAAHYYISIIPTISPRLLSGRQYKLFVTVNGARLMASNRDFPTNGEMNGMGSRKQVYDAALTHGVNRIEVEVVAVANRGGALETEKLNVFANLMKV